MKIRRSIAVAWGIAAASGVLATAAAEQHASQQNGAVTKSLQEHPVSADDPRLRPFYDLLVEARARGADTVDAELEKDVRDMARTLPAGHGLGQKAWEDHVVDMAGQMLAIGKTDPKVFESFERFVVGLRGPQ